MYSFNGAARNMRRPYKFLLVAGFADSLINFRGALIDELISRGVEVHVVAPGLSVDSEIRANLEAKGLYVYDISLARTGLNPLTDVSTFFSLLRIMRAIGPDFVLGYTVKPVIYGSLAAFFAGVPRRFALITGLGYSFQAQNKFSLRGGLLLLVRWLYSISLRRVHKVFFQNPDDLYLFRSAGIISSGTSVCVVNGSGVDVDKFALTPLPSSPRFLMIARLLGGKGVREYVGAARLVRKRYPEVKFSLVGWIDGNPDAIRQQELDAWVADGSVEYLGKLTDVRQAIKDCSVYVLPSYREGTPRTVLEAMAMGRAVITTDAPGCRETVKDGQNGFLVPVKATEELAYAMFRFIEAPKLIYQMGRCAREVALAKYDVNKVNAVMLTEMGFD